MPRDPVRDGGLLRPDGGERLYDGVRDGGIRDDGGVRPDGGATDRPIIRPPFRRVAIGTGTYLESGEGGTFEILFTRLDGTPLATMKGSFKDPSYAPRGSFQATFRCAR
jgi:hypothetical protein